MHTAYRRLDIPRAESDGCWEVAGVPQMEGVRRWREGARGSRHTHTDGGRGEIGGTRTQTRLDIHRHLFTQSAFALLRTVHREFEHRVPPRQLLVNRRESVKLVLDVGLVLGVQEHLEDLGTCSGIWGQGFIPVYMDTPRLRENASP